MTDLERLALVLRTHDVAKIGLGEIEWSRLDADSQKHWLSLARAVLTALREPSEAMLRKAVVQTEPNPADYKLAHDAMANMPPVPAHRHLDGTRAIAQVSSDWKAMIDTVLSEGE